MRWVFDDVIVDSDTREILREGRPVTLSLKAFQLLEILIENRPNALTKSQLHDRLWPETFVVEANLANLVGEVRRALNDDPKQPRFIRTVHRFGYAFFADASASSRPDALDSVWRVVWRGGAATLGEGEHIVGRHPSAGVFVDSPSVSRRHARIHVEGDRATFEDLGSKNGSSKGGRPVEGTIRLSDGDVVMAGVVELTFRLLDAVPTESLVSRQLKPTLKQP
jgi:DNA-binding winged helix-turn-helix (wHTH) protein